VQKLGEDDDVALLLILTRTQHQTALIGIRRYTIYNAMMTYSHYVHKV